jgi:hypothetical protein
MKGRGPRNQLQREGITCRKLENPNGSGFVVRLLRDDVVPPQITTIVKQPGQGEVSILTVRTSAHPHTHRPLYGSTPVESEGRGTIITTLVSHVDRHPLARVAIEHLSPPKPLFPSLWPEQQEVGPGEYKLVDGKDEPISTQAGEIIIITEGNQLHPDPLPGVHSRGIYKMSDRIVSFLYHKTDASGELETTERAIVLQGIGYGEHPNHKGQPPTWYLVGPQIGTIDHETGRVVSMPEADIEIPAKHFSVACITDGPLGEPLLANPTLQ